MDTVPRILLFPPPDLSRKDRLPAPRELRGTESATGTENANLNCGSENERGSFKTETATFEIASSNGKGT